MGVKGQASAAWALKLPGDSLSDYLVIVEGVANDANQAAPLVDRTDRRRGVSKQLPLSGPAEQTPV